MRPIDGDDLKNLMCDTLEGLLRKQILVGEEYHIIAAIRMLGQMIDDAKTIEASPVIRCKDCKFFVVADNIYYEDDFEPYPACELCRDSWGEMPIKVSENDFCSRAERREE